MFSLLLIFLVLLCFSAFFSGSETALFSLSKVQLHKYRESRAASAVRILEQLREPRRLLVTILLGNEFANFSLAIVAAAFVNRFDIQPIELELLFSVGLITPLLLVFGDILPKNLALQFAPQIAPVVVWPLAAFSWLVRPLRAAFTAAADSVVRLFGGPRTGAQPVIMEEEYRRLVDIGRKEGVIFEEEREIIHNVFEFTDKIVAEIMTPAQELFALSVDLPYGRVLDEIRDMRYSRVPFFEGRRDNVVGILHVRDLFVFSRRHRAEAGVPLRDILKPPLFIEPSTPLEQLLREFQRTQQHMAIVCGPDRAPVGVVTMDDVLEELFGEIES